MKTANKICGLVYISKYERPPTKQLYMLWSETEGAHLLSRLLDISARIGKDVLRALK